MTIETKYNIGDEVWCNYRNEEWGSTDKTRVVKGYIRAIFISIFDKSELYIKYSVSERMDSRNWFSKLESDIFPTKEELLKSL
jgi:hypothetical protein